MKTSLLVIFFDWMNRFYAQLGCSLALILSYMSVDSFLVNCGQISISYYHKNTNFFSTNKLSQNFNRLPLKKCAVFYAVNHKLNSHTVTRVTDVDGIIYGMK